MTVPAGRTVTYQSVACAIGNSRAARAVGGAVSANPIAIMIPCHRVIRSNGSIGGYAGGSWVKAVLLELEQVSKCLYKRSPILGREQPPHLS